MARISDERPKQALKTDILVVGGGAAGLAAACTAASLREQDTTAARLAWSGEATV